MEDEERSDEQAVDNKEHAVYLFFSGTYLPIHISTVELPGWLEQHDQVGCALKQQ